MNPTKSTLVAAAAAALALAGPSAAFAGGHGHGKPATTHTNQGKSTSHFSANGKVTAVAADGFTMHVKGGSKDLHGSDVTVTVTDTTKMRRDGAKAQVSDLQVGDRVNANGSRADDGTLTARHVNAEGPAASDTSTDDPESGDAASSTG